ELRAPRSLRGWGRGGGIRTPDILVPNQVRYQTALHPADRNSTLTPAPLPRRGPSSALSGWSYCCADSAGAGGCSSRRGGGSSSAFLDRRTRPLSSASSTFTFTIWPSLR